MICRLGTRRGGRDEDDDHSMSNFDQNSLRSRRRIDRRHDRQRVSTRFKFASMLMLRLQPRSPRSSSLQLATPLSLIPKDPLLAKRSMSSLHKMSSRLGNTSNPSLESQLAHDFQARANVASSSSTSLGQIGQSTISLGPYPWTTDSIASCDVYRHTNPLATCESTAWTRLSTDESVMDIHRVWRFHMEPEWDGITGTKGRMFIRRAVHYRGYWTWTSRVGSTQCSSS